MLEMVTPHLWFPNINNMGAPTRPLLFPPSPQCPSHHRIPRGLVHITHSQ